MTTSSPEMQARLIGFQRNEITEHHIFLSFLTGYLLRTALEL